MKKTYSDSDKEFDKKYGPRRDFAFKVRYLVSEHPMLAYMALCVPVIVGAMIDVCSSGCAPSATIISGLIVFATILIGAIWAYVKDENR